jgi:type IV pilus assembly protein PilQ
MLGTISGGARRFAALAGVAFLAACAASTAVAPEAPQQPHGITDVRVETGSDATVVTLVGVEHPVFTAFALADPERVVVDITSVAADESSERVAVNDGLVEEVELSAFSTGVGDEMTRVVIGLTEPADFTVISTEVGLEISIRPMAAMSQPDLEMDPAEDSAADDPWVVDEAAAPTPAVGPSWEAPQASSLVAIEAMEAGDDGSLVHLVADGVVSAAVTFTLEDPDRLVIDLAGLVSQVAQPRLDLESSHAARIRVGQHADMVRVVVDAGDAANAFDGRRLVPVSDGLLIALGTGEALDAALANASSAPAQTLASGDADHAPPMTADMETDMASASDMETDWEVTSGGASESDWEAETPAAEGALAEADLEAEPEAPADVVTIYGVEFDSQTERDRIVVVGEQPVDYLVYEPDPETLVFSFTGAAIDPEAAVRIAPEFGGPISLITSFEQPDVENPEVRLVVKRAPGLQPEISRRGPLLLVDFEHAGVAATPPVLEDQPGTVVLSELETGTMPEPMLSAPAGEPMPAAGAVAAVAPEMPSGPLAAPASLEPQASIDVLAEGGLIDGKAYIGRRISLDFKDVEIGDVLRLIAEVSDLNVIAGDEVKGRVTIRLVDVPWDQALDVVLLTKNLGFMRVGNVLRVAPAPVIKAEEESRLQERRAKEKLEDLIVKLQPVNYADVADVSAVVQRLLSARGTVHVDSRTNTLIIKDIPSVVDEATALVKAIDTQTPQVMIEAKIVEASLDFSREFGSVWTAGTQPLVDGFDSGSAAREDLGVSDFRLHDANNFSSLNPITAGPTALANLGAFILDEKLNLDVQLQAAEVNGDGKVISSPRVVTLDNSEAKIEQGVSIPFQTFENGDAALEFVDAVLSLNVTPHITADRSIIMKIEVSRNAPDDSVFTLTGSPAIAKNQVKTETLVKDGRTLVLGGIYVVDKSQRQSRVPYLHKIPVLGAAFRSDEVSDSRKELLIFVTPSIVLTQPVDAT